VRNETYWTQLTAAVGNPKAPMSLSMPNAQSQSLLASLLHSTWGVIEYAEMVRNRAAFDIGRHACNVGLEIL